MERDDSIRAFKSGAVFVALITLPAYAIAAPRPFDIRGGTLADAVAAVGRQGGVSIAVRDAQMLRRPAPRLRGRMEPHAALNRIAGAAGLTVKKLGPTSFLLLAAERRAPTSHSRVAAPARRVLPIVTPQLPEQDIVITASKRDTLRARFAGQSLSIRGDLLTRNGLLGTEAIESRSFLTSTHLGAGRNKLFIRGIADSSFSGPTQSPVGIYVGDMRVGYSGPDPDLRLVDMKNVEILEGPQGTLYGAGTLGGIVLLQPTLPRVDNWEFRLGSGASTTAHGERGFDLSGTVNMPIADGVALRAVGYRVREGGYVDNRLSGRRDINDVQVDGGRAQFLAHLGPDWSIEVMGLAQRIEGQDSQYADRGSLSRASMVDQPFSSRFIMGSTVLRKDSGDIRFRSTFGMTAQKLAETFDASVDGQAQTLIQRAHARAITNETRLWRPMRDGWSWIAGFSAITHRYRTARDLQAGVQSQDWAGSENKVSEFTGFGEIGMMLSRSVEANVGLRYTHSTLRGAGSNLSAAVMADIASLGAARTERRLLPSLSVLVRPFADTTVYARYQHGFRPGGLSISNLQARLFENDTLATSEIGVRYGNAGIDRFSLQAGVSHSEWRNIQADFLDSSGLPVTDNIGDGRVWSASARASMRLSTGLTVDAGITFNDGMIDRPSESFRQAVLLSQKSDGMRIPNIARWVGRVGAVWQQSTPFGEIQAEGYVRYVGKSRLGIGPRLGEEQGNHVDSGASLSLTSGNRTYSVSATNLADQVGNRFAFGAPALVGPDQGTPLRPRTIRIGIEQAF